MNPYTQYKESGVESIGKIPAHWECCLTKHKLTKITDGAHISPETENGVHPFISTVNINKGQIDFNCCLLTSQKSFDLLSSQGCRPKIGDVLFSKDGTIGKTVVVGNATSFVVASSLIILTPARNVVVSKYLDYLLQSRVVIEQINSFVKGSALRRLSLLNLKKIYGVFPPLAEQTAIATYLDGKTAQIDTLIAKKQRLIELLCEEHTAIISHSVTKGLEAMVELKDSGVQWIGEIPAHWEVIKLKYLTTKIGSGVTPKGGSSVYTSNGVPLIRSQNVHFGGLRVGNIAHIPEEIHKSMKSSKVLPNDVLLNITGASIGRCCIVPFKIREANVNQHVCIVRPNTKISSKYLNFFLASENGQGQIFSGEKGISREGLNFEELKSFTVTLPTRSEQQAIAAYLDQKTAQIDALIAKTKKQIELLQEYRTALISSVVTGKVDVRQEGVE